MDELEDDAKARILLEEKYRAEVRSQLPQEDKREKKTPLMTFLNSSFGLWALSALFISGAGSLYTQRQTNHAEQLKKQEQREADDKRLHDLHRRMELEVSHRFSETLIRLSDVSEIGDHHKLRAGHTGEDVKQILDEFATGIGSKLAPLYPELANQSALAMVTELSDQTKQSDPTELTRAVGDLSGLSILMEVQGAPLSDPFLVAAAMDRRLKPLKFTDDYYFLDCSESDPFC